jgi:diguanylate cyclase (GGDEF)-like protein
LRPLLTESDAEAAAGIAEKLRLTIADRAITRGSSEVAPHITASLGVATVIPKADASARELVETADRALYQAKKSGRNRVVCASR